MSEWSDLVKRNGVAVALVVCPATKRWVMEKRSKDVMYSGTWGLPGGAVEDGEEPAEAARRELAEEVGLHGARYLKQVRMGDDPKTVCVVFIVDAESKLRKSKESTAVQWTDYFPGDLIPVMEEDLQKYKDLVAEACLPRHTREALDPFTPAFKSWFGQSKVVDEYGKPLRMFHGTVYDIKEFKREYLGKGHDQEGPGFYFTSDPDSASGYASDDRTDVSAPKTGPNIMPVYLRITKPVGNKPLTPAQIRAIISAGDPESLWNFGDVGFDGKTKVLNEAVEAYRHYEHDVKRALFSLANDFYKGEDGKFLQVVTKTTGYDGMIVHRPTATHCVVFSPEQIKSVFNKSPGKSAAVNAAVEPDAKATAGHLMYKLMDSIRSNPVTLTVQGTKVHVEFDKHDVCILVGDREYTFIVENTLAGDGFYLALGNIGRDFIARLDRTKITTPTTLLREAVKAAVAALPKLDTRQRAVSARAFRRGSRTAQAAAEPAEVESIDSQWEYLYELKSSARVGPYVCKFSNGHINVRREITPALAVTAIVNIRIRGANSTNPGKLVVYCRAMDKAITSGAGTRTSSLQDADHGADIVIPEGLPKAGLVEVVLRKSAEVVERFMKDNEISIHGETLVDPKHKLTPDVAAVRFDERVWLEKPATVKVAGGEATFRSQFLQEHGKYRAQARFVIPGRHGSDIVLFVFNHPETQVCAVEPRFSSRTGSALARLRLYTDSMSYEDIAEAVINAIKADDNLLVRAAAEPTSGTPERTSDALDALSKILKTKQVRTTVQGQLVRVNHGGFGRHHDHYVHLLVGVNEVEFVLSTSANFGAYLLLAHTYDTIAKIDDAQGTSPEKLLRAAVQAAIEAVPKLSARDLKHASRKSAATAATEPGHASDIRDEMLKYTKDRFSAKHEFNAHAGSMDIKITLSMNPTVAADVFVAVEVTPDKTKDEVYTFEMRALPLVDTEYKQLRLRFDRESDRVWCVQLGDRVMRQAQFLEVKNWQSMEANLPNNIRSVLVKSVEIAKKVVAQVTKPSRVRKAQAATEPVSGDVVADLIEQFRGAGAGGTGSTSITLKVSGHEIVVMYHTGVLNIKIDERHQYYLSVYRASGVRHAVLLRKTSYANVHTVQRVPDDFHGTTKQLLQFLIKAALADIPKQAQAAAEPGGSVRVLESLKEAFKDKPAKVISTVADGEKVFIRINPRNVTLGGPVIPGVIAIKIDVSKRNLIESPTSLQVEQYSRFVITTDGCVYDRSNKFVMRLPSLPAASNDCLKVLIKLCVKLHIDVVKHIYEVKDRIARNKAQAAQTNPTPADLGKRLKAALATDEAYKLLDTHTEGADTWLAGGCALLARALSGLGLGHLVVLEGAQQLHGKLGPKQVQHWLVQAHGIYLDGDGASTKDALVKRWHKHESMREIALRRPTPDDFKHSTFTASEAGSAALQNFLKDRLQLP